jgi:hypothetical protein
MHSRLRSVVVVVLFAALGIASPASALGIGLEVGASAGGSELATHGIDINLAGTSLSLLLSLDLLRSDLLHLQALGRLEGGALFVFARPGNGVGGLGGAELLLRSGIAAPGFEPFAEVGAGAALGVGATTSSSSTTMGALWTPAAYAGLGATFSAPNLPYFEVRMGMHAGALLGVPSQPSTFAPKDALFARAALHLGSGLRF